MTKGFQADIEPVRARIAGDVESRLTGIFANELAYERRMIESNAPADKHVDMAKLIQWYVKTFYEEVLKPRLDAAGDSCAAGQLAIQTMLGIIPLPTKLDDSERRTAILILVCAS